MESKENNSNIIPDVVVVGASNMDLISTVPRLPFLGETLHGSTFSTGFGGKGANQAACIGKLGGKCMFVGKVGTDTFGKGMVDNLNKIGINTAGVTVTDKASSGVAPIFVDSEGRNGIVIVNGANDLLTKEDIQAVEPIIKQAKILVVQLEIQYDISLFALQIAKKHGLLTILNPAPAPSPPASSSSSSSSPWEALPPAMMEVTDIIIPNEIEALTISSLPPDSEIAITTSTSPAASSVTLPGLHSHLHSIKGNQLLCSVITLGGNGASLAFSKDPTQVQLIPAPKHEVFGFLFFSSLLNFSSSSFSFPLSTFARVKDTSGAGDCFIGAFTFFLSKHLEVLMGKGKISPVEAFKQLCASSPDAVAECVRNAAILSSDSVTRSGTQVSYPGKEKLDSLVSFSLPL